MEMTSVSMVVKNIFRIIEGEGSLKFRQVAFVQCDDNAIALGDKDQGLNLRGVGREWVLGNKRVDVCRWIGRQQSIGVVRQQSIGGMGYDGNNVVCFRIRRQG